MHKTAGGQINNFAFRSLLQINHLKYFRNQKSTMRGDCTKEVFIGCSLFCYRQIFHSQLRKSVQKKSLYCKTCGGFCTYSIYLSDVSYFFPNSTPNRDIFVVLILGPESHQLMGFSYVH